MPLYLMVNKMGLIATRQSDWSRDLTTGHWGRQRAGIQQACYIAPGTPAAAGDAHTDVRDGRDGPSVDQPAGPRCRSPRKKASASGRSFRGLSASAVCVRHRDRVASRRCPSWLNPDRRQRRGCRPGTRAHPPAISPAIRPRRTRGRMTGRPVARRKMPRTFSPKPMQSSTTRSGRRAATRSATALYSASLAV